MGLVSFSSVSLPLLLFFLLLTMQLHQTLSVRAETTSKVYVVYMGAKQHEDPNLVTALHHDMLTSVLGSKEAALESMLYSYKHGFSGFSATLTESQAKQISKIPGVIRVTPSHSCELQTTRSWDFLGLDYSHPTEILSKTNQGDGVIIGVVDTGIWPESRSFNDHGYGPIPSRWNGTCEEGKAFNVSHCNRKIIGARWYARGVDPDLLKTDYLSPRDGSGHGTHTASTTAGSIVSNVSFGGLGTGVARGGAPRAHLAIYKVLWGTRGVSHSATVLAAVDDAIHDRVDILSLSLTLNSLDISLVYLHAVEKGITVIFSAGNNGPRPQSLSIAFPWVITVAASTMDRSFPASITLGNNISITGQRVIGLPMRQDGFKLLFFSLGDLSCNGPLNSTLVAGKVVLCFTDWRPPSQQFPIAVSSVTQAGGIGLIFAQYTDNLPQACGNISCILIDYDNGVQIRNYIEQSSAPMVKMGLATTVIGSSILAPKIASFSSRGPNPFFPTILKPDVAAPGVNILAAIKDHYEFRSGTSMACPHVAGIAALLKSMHPNWSPAAIKSALVTTASITDEYGLPITAEGAPRKLADPFDYGGGHVSPNRAVDPGLIYDINATDYFNWVDEFISDLNLPSISIPDLKTTTTVSRTVTNVGPVNSTYIARIQSPPGIKMDVTPSILVFNDTVIKHSFKIKFSAIRRVQGDYTFGNLIWSDYKHSVKIPIAVRTVTQDSYADISL